MRQRTGVADLGACSFRQPTILGRRANSTRTEPTTLNRARTSAVRTLGRFLGKHEVWTAIFQGRIWYSRMSRLMHLPTPAFTVHASDALSPNVFNDNVSAPSRPPTRNSNRRTELSVDHEIGKYLLL